jgi:hypothetical protein
MLFLKSVKTIVFSLLLIGLTFPAAFGASPAASKAAYPAANDATAKKAVSSPEARKLVVYYFHGDARCVTCRKFEALTEEIMRTRFAEDVRRGRVEYRVVNVDDRANSHFVADYGLFTKSVVLSDVRDGDQTRWKNLDKIWEKVRDEAAYRRYIEDEVRSFLKGA